MFVSIALSRGTSHREILRRGQTWLRKPHLESTNPTFESFNGFAMSPLQMKTGEPPQLRNLFLRLPSGSVVPTIALYLHAKKKSCSHEISLPTWERTSEKREPAPLRHGCNFGISAAEQHSRLKLYH
jgi:hypothetical protein